MGPLQNTFLLGALLFSKIVIIVIFLKIYYSLGIHFVNSWIKLPPKKNWKLLNLAAKPLRIRGGFLALRLAQGEMRSD